MEKPCWCPLEGHQHGGQKVTETSVIAFNLPSKRKVKIIVILYHLFSHQSERKQHYETSKVDF